jgi:hypothetical protein
MFFITIVRVVRSAAHVKFIGNMVKIYGIVELR